MWKRPIATALLVVALAAVAIATYDFGNRALWHGEFPLEIRLEPKGTRQIVTVAFDTLARREWAEAIRQDIGRAELNFRPVGDFDGRTFTVRVRHSGSTSALGRELTYAQYQLLILRLEFADGEIRYEVVEIPEGRGPRQIVVEVR